MHELLEGQLIVGSTAFSGMIKNFSLALNDRPTTSEGSFLKKPHKLSDFASDEFTFICSLYELGKFNPIKYELHRSRVPWQPRAE